MKRCSPTLEGFQIMFRLPSLGLAEIAWRWSFGLAVGALLVFSLREYLATLPMTAGEMFFLRSRQPALILQAIARIFHGSATRAVVAAIVLMLALTLAWVVLASLGRAATLKTLFECFRESEDPSQPDVPCGRGRLARERQTGTWRLGPLIGLNVFRAVVMLAAALGSLGALLLAAAAAPEGHPSPGSVLLIFYTLIMFVGLAWLVLNWFLSLAAVFVVGDGRDTFGALGAAVGLCWTRPGAMTAATTWFSFAHVLVFVVASSVVAFPLAFAEVLPAGVVLGGLLLVTLLYFAVVDFLHVAQLAAYVCMVEVPEASAPESSQPSALSIQPLGTLSDEHILSDIPGLVPPPETAGG
jgi:hypothetical protein